jgi:hypothetical protein
MTPWAHPREVTDVADTAVIVVQIWRERSSPSGIRARVSSRLDVLEPAQETATTESIEQIGTLVAEAAAAFARKRPA